VYAYLCHVKYICVYMYIVHACVRSRPCYRWDMYFCLFTFVYVYTHIYIFI